MPTTAPPSPPGLPAHIDFPEVPVGSILAGAAARYGDRAAFRYGERTLTYTELWHAACRFSNALHDRGVAPGDTVAIHLPNRLAFPIAYYGILLAGATFSPANPLLPPADLVTQLADSGAVAAVTFGPAARALDAAGLATVIVSEPTETGALDFEDFLAGAEDTPPPPGIDIHTDLAHIAYTGGTTGRSKGVRLTHRNVVVNTLQYCCWSTGSVPMLDDAGNLTLDQIGSEAEWRIRLGTAISINLTPWFHAMGTIAALNASVLTGHTLAIQDRLDPAAYLAEAERLRVTGIGGAPALFGALLACPDIETRDLSSVRAISSGAAPMPHEMIKALEKRFPEATISEGYGLTEVTMGATTAPSWQSGVRKPATVGVPTFGTEIKVVAPDGEEPLPPNTSGEVCIRGPQVMQGYHNREAETAEVLVDGWLHTGDIGVIDDDGFLSIVDRKKDMLLYKGYNVYPRELEELLAAQPGVAAAAVVGKQAAEGELPVAFVVRAPGHEELAADDLMGAVNDQVVPYKRVREVRFVDEIPVSAAGKVLKRELRDQLT